MVEDPLGLFPKGDQFFAGDSLAEPAVGLIPLEDLPSGVSLAEPAQAAPEAQHVEQPDQAQPASEALPASSGGRGRRPAVSSPLHILLPEDAIGGMGTLFADNLPGPSTSVLHQRSWFSKPARTIHVRALQLSFAFCS